MTATSQEYPLNHNVFYDPDLSRRHWKCVCTCGATWTVPFSRGEDEVFETIDAHRRYANRPKMVTL